MSTVLVSHPTGNPFVRALLAHLAAQKKLAAFYTTLAVQPGDWYVRAAPAPLRRELLRRTYDLPVQQIRSRPWRESVRLFASRIGPRFLTAHERGWASVDAIWQDLDRRVAARLPEHRAQAVYCYEDAALETFRAAHRLGLGCCYDLPIAYWQTSRRLLEEEAQRLPEWEPTLVGTRDSEAKLERKSEELALADVVICPSRFVYDSLPESVREDKRCVVAEFGSPVLAAKKRAASETGPLRVLFAGSLSQRKGLADLFAAIRLLGRSDIELVVLGTPLLPLPFYRRQLPDFTYEAPRPHALVLQLMQSCHLLALPSIVEGRALVQQEAMVCGLPLLITPNTGGEDLIEEGRTGFLVPIRSPEKLAEKLDWFADRRAETIQMGQQARQRAMEITWKAYCEKILAVLPGL
ncbi:glycosyltransferase family 4 protein [Gloeobacter kilaueensis]|uniref:Glycosyl transferase group 1 n=1 Tax=Gloeobacter kilaueensis (strain ATCC BAA-2537 / CCAP 1431/1 / ULC 316 / JS1) TaxID=1183438 RepID=U5QPB8_GLOK1|nr:glycosyltransferase family 4 protein [Gloeobacter kilaueensis]AGY59510.1 glycosyl transferase group 1 [Gloeobacter kilaueensis JS1]